MKKWFKKIVAAVLTAAMVMTAGVPAFAEDSMNSESIQSYTMSEYDMYLDLKSKTPATILSDDNNASNIEFVQNDGVEQLLLERAQLYEDELKEIYGYTDEQIAILKEYDGSSLEENPQLRSVLAEVSIYLNKGYTSTSKISAYIGWNWSSCPLVLLGVNDILAVAFEPTNANGGTLNLRFDSTYSYCDVTYCRTSGTTYERITYDLTTDPSAGVYNNAYVDFECFRMVENNTITTYAKQGVMYLVVNATANNLSEIGFTYRYGHAMNRLPVDITINLSIFSITFGNAAATAQRKAIITSNGTLESIS